MTFWRWFFTLLGIIRLPRDLKVPPDDGQAGPVLSGSACPDPAAIESRDNRRIASILSRMEEDGE